MAGGIEIKTADEIAYMREASLIVCQVLDELEKAVVPGITLDELDAIAERETVQRGGMCAFKGLYGFPKNVCISANEQVLQGIPTRRKLIEGDLLNLDYGHSKPGRHARRKAAVATGAHHRRHQRRPEGPDAPRIALPAAAHLSLLPEQHRALFLLPASERACGLTSLRYGPSDGKWERGSNLTAASC